MTTHYTDFPFEFKAQFNHIEEGLAIGFAKSQIWAVLECDGAWAFVPPHHYVNRLYFVATAEHHDGDTYYEEPVDPDMNALDDEEF